MLTHAVMGREALPESYKLHILGVDDVFHTRPSLPVFPDTLVSSSAALVADHYGFALCMISF